MNHAHHRTTKRVVDDPVHVPGHLIPKPCPMCKREIVRVPTKAGIVHVDYSTIKHRNPNQSGLLGGYNGLPHDCPATRRVP